MNVLVTGGAGYIGSHTCKALAAFGHPTVVYDDLRRGHAWAVRWGPLVQGELADRALLVRTMRIHQIEAVLHFAAYASVGESMRDPGLYFENNVGGSLNLLEALREARVPLLVFSSSCATYGIPDRMPINESHPQRPVNPYGESKLAVERAIEWYGRIHGVRWVTLRYFNAAGADSCLETGEEHCPETHLVPLVLEAALSSATPLSVFGTDYPTPDGTAVRDYVHVSDLADAHVRALHYLDAGGPSRAFNLGTGRGWSVREIIAAAAEITGIGPRVINAARRPGDPAVLVADAAAARAHLQWQPRHSGLREIVETAWRWRTRLVSQQVSA